MTISQNISMLKVHVHLFLQVYLETTNSFGKGYTEIISMQNSCNVICQFIHYCSHSMCYTLIKV